jgi:hypothetical protein
MPAWVVTVPGVEDLASLAAAAAELAAAADLAVVPAVPEHGYGPEVCLGPGVLDLPGFLGLAARLGGGVLYLRAVPSGPGSDDGQDDEEPGAPPTHLAGHAGQTGQVSIAFAAGGLVHFWEHRTAWYQEWQDLADSRPRSRGHETGEDVEDGEDEGLSGEDRARLAGELAGAILADPRFRAAPPASRQRLARLAIPAGTDSWAGHDAIREACDRARDMTAAAYGQLAGRLDGLAAELAASPAYQQARSAAGRRAAAAQFLIPRADGFSPPGLVRDELYARAQQLARRTAAGGLF